MLNRLKNLVRNLREGAKASREANKKAAAIDKRLVAVDKRLVAVDKRLNQQLVKVEKGLHRQLGGVDKRLELVEQHLSNALPQLSFSELPPSGMRCPICLAGEIRWTSAYPSHLERFRMATLLFCDQCGSGHMPGAAKVLGDYYAVDYSTTNRKDRSVDPAVYFESTNPKLAPYFNRAKHQTEALRKRGATFGKVLDYGSGPGYFLYATKAAEPYAIELDTASDKYLQYLGANRITADDIPADFFDVVLCSHVVEHFTAEDLQKNLQSMVRSLKANGLLLIEVPNGSLSRVRYRGDQSPHTLFFTPDGIRRAVELAGGNVQATYARQPLDRVLHANAIYHPDPTDEFISTTRQGLTVIATRT